MQDGVSNLFARPTLSTATECGGDLNACSAYTVTCESHSMDNSIVYPFQTSVLLNH